jgi:hypothetical protein
MHAGRRAGAAAVPIPTAICVQSAQFISCRGSAERGRDRTHDMTDEIHWGSYDQLQRNAARTRNSLAGVTLNLPNDSGPVQSFQTEGHVGELRNSQPRVENNGFSSLPLPGAKGVAVYLNGNRGGGIIVATVDARYRPTGLKPGESQLYMIDSAKDDGSGGTTRTVLKATLGWVLSLFGKTINVGDTQQQHRIGRKETETPI